MYYIRLTALCAA